MTGAERVVGVEPGWVSRLRFVLFRRREASIAFVALALFAYFGSQEPAFLSSSNLRVISQFTAAVAILAVGEVMLLICGEIDLSVGHVYAMAPFVMFFAMEAGLPFLPAVVLAILAAGVVGVINGGITVKTGVPSFIVTLGMLFLLNGFTLTISGGFPKAAPRGGLLVGIFGDLPAIGIVWAVVIVAVMHVVLSSTPWGVYTFATGGNPLGAREAGVPTDLIKVGNFVLTSMLGGFAGIIESIRVNSIDPLGGGESLMFLAVASAVIGGTALAGGSGTVIGGFLGAVVLGVLRDGLTLQGYSAFTFNQILGIFIVASMLLNVWVARLRRSAPT